MASTESRGRSDLLSVDLVYRHPLNGVGHPAALVRRVFAEVARVLRPGGVFIVSFSNRMFAQKAIRAWREASGPERLRLVEGYFETTGAFEEPETIGESPHVPPTQRVLGGAPDPFYALTARTPRAEASGA